MNEEWQKAIRAAQDKRRLDEAESARRDADAAMVAETEAAKELKTVLSFFGIDAAPVGSSIVIGHFQFSLLGHLQCWTSDVDGEMLRFTLSINRLPEFPTDAMQDFYFELHREIEVGDEWFKAKNKIDWEELQADLADKMDMLDEVHAQLATALQQPPSERPDLPENLQQAVGFLQMTIADIEMGCCTPAQHLLIALARFLDTLPQPAFDELD